MLVDAKQQGVCNDVLIIYSGKCEWLKLHWG